MNHTIAPSSLSACFSPFPDSLSLLTSRKNPVINQYQEISLTPISVPNVSTLISDPSQYEGNPIILNAIVSKTYPSQHQFTIADKTGCSLCTAKNALNSITVWYQGEIPKVRESVRISGSVIHDEKSGYVIIATYVRN